MKNHLVTGGLSGEYRNRTDDLLAASQTLPARTCRPVRAGSQYMNRPKNYN